MWGNAAGDDLHASSRSRQEETEEAGFSNRWGKMPLRRGARGLRSGIRAVARVLDRSVDNFFRSFDRIDVDSGWAHE
jgi:hypothetical protein